ncbi:ATP-dependent DNA ligase [Microbacterium sp. PAMC 28756]|nr:MULTISPECIES: ATP-dependent DNA ligase [Microbacterium]AMG85044.1 ATP-dependent DNA ligase [Microbacterium sp. PAMC 28756]
MPAGLRPPLGVALARPVETVPAADALPGGARYEPKWDGFRLLLVVDDDITLWSRQGKNLTRAFPELVAAAAQLPNGVILDGEAVVWSDDRLDFDALLRRTNGSSSTVAKLSRAQPASYVAFDILAIADRDARDLRLDDRRTLLEELAREWSPPLNLSPVTADAAEAARWFRALVASGIEGLVVKGGAQPYVGGDRTWVKVKHHDTLDVICAAVIGSRERPEELVVGLPIDGELRIVGRSARLAANTARKLGRLLQEPAASHPWPQEVKPGALSRFNRSGREPVRLTLVQPLVVEISADVAMAGQSFRHVVRFVRARPEIPVAEVEPSR